MRDTTPQQLEAPVRDPVCGMTVDPALAFATRILDEETFSFCSERCVQQFGREHTGSATTGVSGTARLLSVELPVTDGDHHHGIVRLQEHLSTMQGVVQVMANAKSNLLRVIYDPSAITLEAIVDHVRKMGYIVGVSTTYLAIQGIHCASCVVTIEKALQQVRGVLSATVNPATQQAHVVYLPGLIDLARLTHAIEAAGYQVPVKKVASTETTADHAEQDRTRKYTLLLRKFWFAVIISIPVIIFSYPQLFPGLRDWLAPGSIALRIAWATLGVLTLPIMFWAGNHFYTGMWQALKHRQANMHTLIAIGISAAWLYSTVAVLVPQIFPTQQLAQTFYDVTAVVVALVNLGLALKLRAKGRTSEAIKKLIGLQAKTARVIRDRVEVDIPFEEVLVGDTVVVRSFWGRESPSFFPTSSRLSYSMPYWLSVWDMG